jgi:hypothetical protein
MPLWLVELQTRAWVAHPATTFQTVPPSVWDRNWTVPAGAPWLSEPGELINRVAVAVNASPETELDDERPTVALVCAAFTTWVTGVTDADP